MPDEPKTIAFEVDRVKEIGKSLVEVGTKHKASIFELMLALTGEVCRKYHRNRLEDELPEILSSLIPDDAREVANGGN